MRKVEMRVGELALLVGTRALLRTGLGLLLADHLSGEQRKAVGLTLLSVGVLTTLPLALDIFASIRESTDAAPA